jgi:hypothetical protein
MSLPCLGFSGDARAEYLKVIREFLNKTQYAVKYNSYLISRDGAETALSDDSSIVVRNNLTLFTTTKNLDYIINTEGSLIVNHIRKRIIFNYHPYTSKEKKELEKTIDAQITQKLSKAVEECDSIKKTQLNGYDIYTMYAKFTPYSKAECWVNSNNEIQEVRYYFADGDYLYQRIVYSPVSITPYLSAIELSNYIVKVNAEKYEPTLKYKTYEVELGH